MATTTSQPKKKSATKTTKRTSVKKAPAKKSVGARSKASSQMRSFKLEKQSTPFLTFSPSIQSLYWVIIGVAVIACASLILKQQSDIQALYDEIDMINAQQVILDEPVEATE